MSFNQQMVKTSRGLNLSITGGASVLHNSYRATMDEGETMTSGWLDFTLVDKYQITARADRVGMSLKIESRSDPAQTPLETVTTYDDSMIALFTVTCREVYLRFTWTNTTGATVAGVSLTVKTFFGSSDGLSVFPVNVEPSSFSQAALVQSILRGVDSTGRFQQVKVNSGGALVVANPILELLRGRVKGATRYSKFGLCDGLSPGDAGDVFYAPNAEYPGFSAPVAAPLEIVSTSNVDAGIVRATGTTTDGTATTLVDAGGNFAAVVAGDMVVNTTRMAHGVVTHVDATVLTLARLCGGPSEATVVNSPGDSYMVVSVGGEGASLVRVYHMLDSAYGGYHSEYIVMNGTIPTTTLGSYIRCTHAEVILSGGAGHNRGDISGSIDGVNAFVLKNKTNQTYILADTVPTNKWLYVQSITINLRRSKGTVGSAIAQFKVRRRGEVWTTAVFVDITTEGRYKSDEAETIAIPPMSDFLLSYSDVSDRGGVSGGVAGVLVDLFAD